jgi:hypothetical protein
VKQGRIRLLNGFSANCSYEFSSEHEGRLAAFSALYSALPEGERATLVLGDGEERMIRLVRRLNLEEALFEVTAHASR